MQPEPLHNARCRANHLSHPWAVEPLFLGQAVQRIRAGAWPLKPLAAWDDEGPVPESPATKPPPPPPYRVTAGGVALVPIQGVMMKGFSKFADVDTLEVRRQLRLAADDSKVRAILLQIDSPGGGVSGTMELADDVWAANRKKPVHAHIEDTGASAAYWVASQARRVTANAMAKVGSIGVLSVVVDSSGAAKEEGLVVHVVSTGEFKGAFTDGAPIPEEHLAFLRSMVEASHVHFLAAIERGRGARGLSGEGLKKVADGRVWIASEARQLALIDEVRSLDDAHTDLVGEIDKADLVAREGRSRADRARAAMARARHGL